MLFRDKHENINCLSRLALNDMPYTDPPLSLFEQPKMATGGAGMDPAKTGTKDFKGFATE